MKIIDRIRQAADSIDSSEVRTYAAETAFILSLIPIPGIQQAGSIATRILDNAEIERKFSELEKRISLLSNSPGAGLGTGERAIKISEILHENSDLKSLAAEIAERIEAFLSEHKTEFVVETRNLSYQEIIDSSISAEFSAFISDGNSQNLLRGNKITSQKTQLTASNNSINRIHNTTFADGSKSVSMSGIAQKGNVSVSGTQVTFHGDSQLIFEAPMKGVCPICNTIIEVHKSDMAGYTHIQCPNCQTNLPIQY
ncbi:MAG: hypothetical protein HOH66_02335 [Rhodospirillaceae bacterium]|jgi:hypothetical protein|nr:hypothetical protein [Rhodospirillaceae bacterium]